MKQQLLKTWLMIVCLLAGVGSAWAETKTIEINTSNSGVTGSYADKTFTVNGVSFGFTQWMKNTYIQAKKSTTNSCYNVDAIPGKIKKITVVQTGTARAIKMYGGTSSKPTTEISSPSTDATMEFDFSKENYTYFSLTTPGNACYFNTITIEYESTSGGTTPEPTKYNVTIANGIQNGSVTASPTTAAKDATVTLTATPDAGYKLSAWDVKDASSNAVEVKDNKFTMPASDVTVSATFEEKGALIYATLADLVAAGAPTTTGEEVTVTLTNEVITKIYTSGQYRNGIYMMAGDKEIEIYCYNVPAEWVVGGKVSGTLTCDWKLYNTTWELCPTSWNDLSYTAPEGEPEPEPEADNVTFDLTQDNTVAATDELMTWTSTYASMYAQKAGATTKTNNYYPGTIGQTYKSTRFYKNSTLTFNPAPGVTISSIVYEATTTGYASAIVGTEANPSTWVNASASASNTTVTITPEDGTQPVTVTFGNTSGASSVKIYYAGEATDAPYVPSTTEPEPETYTITVNGDIANGSVTASASEAEEGTVITLTATPQEGYELEEYIVTRSDNSDELTVTDNKFTMPAADVNVTATFKLITSTDPEEPTPGEGVTYTFSSFTAANDVTLNANGYTITLHKNTGSTAPTWNGNSNEARLYAKGSVEVTSTKNIVKVVYDYTENAGGKNNLTPTVDGVAGSTAAGEWSADTKTWTGKDNTVTLTTSGSAGNLGFKSITVYFEQEEAPAGKSIAFNATNNGTVYWATFSSSDNIVLSGSIEDWDNEIYAEIAVYAITGAVNGQLNGEPLTGLFDDVEYKWYLPKNTGYLIVSSGIGVEAGHSYPYEIGDDLTFNGIYTDVLASNMLVPSSVAMTNPDNLYYKLTTRNGSNVGFYWGAEDGAPFTMKNQNAAYLAVPKANAVKGFSLSDFETVINRIENAPRANAPIYNLAGQRVNANAKGILIQNGKKFFVK